MKDDAKPECEQVVATDTAGKEESTDWTERSNEQSSSSATVAKQLEQQLSVELSEAVEGILYEIAEKLVAEKSLMGREELRSALEQKNFFLTSLEIEAAFQKLICKWRSIVFRNSEANERGEPEKENRNFWYVENLLVLVLHSSYRWFAEFME